MKVEKYHLWEYLYRRTHISSFLRKKKRLSDDPLRSQITVLSYSVRSRDKSISLSGISFVRYLIL